MVAWYDDVADGTADANILYAARWNAFKTAMATGATDNAILLADGTDGHKMKSSGTLLSALATTSNKIDEFAVAGTSNTDRDANTTNHGLLLKAVAPAAGLLSVPGIANGETIYALKPMFDGTNPAMNGTAAPGTQVIAARRDHVHASDTTRLAVTTANAAKRTIFLSGAGGWNPTTSPAGAATTTETSTNKVNFKGTLFAAGASDIYHEWGMATPDNWDLSTITAEFYFHTVSTDASNHTIIFGLQALASSDTDTLDTAYGTAQESTETVASSIAGKMIMSAVTSAITVGGTPAKADWLQFRVYRKGADTFTGDVILLGVRIHYGTNNYSDE